VKTARDRDGGRRAVVVVFAAAEQVALPAPMPLARLAMLIHVAVVSAVHGDPSGIVTVTVPDPPVAASDWLVGERLATHAGSGVNTARTAPHAPVLSCPRTKINRRSVNGPTTAVATSTVLSKLPSAAVIPMAVPPLQGGVST
jgi:hypothetical protein